MKSKVKSVKFNREWDGTHGKIFYFDIEFDNGNKGQFSTNKREQTKFKEGEEVDYIEKSKTKNGTPIYDKEKVDQPFNKSNYNDPIANKKMAMSVAQSAAGEMYSKLGKVIKKNDNVQNVAKMFYDWIIKEGTNRDVLSLRWNAIQREVSMIPARDSETIAKQVMNHTLSGEIINNASYFIQQLENL